VTLSLSEISTVGASFAEDVEAYGAAGFDAIGIWEFKLPPDDEANLALLAEHGLGVSVCVPEVPSVLPLAIPGMEGPSDVVERIAALEASVRRLASYDPECVACLAGPLGDRTLEQGMDLLIDALQRLGAVAREAGTWVGFEPVHRSQEETAGFVNSLAEADLVLAIAAAPQVGILFDTYHLWDDPDVLPWIEANISRIVGVHISDWPAGDRTDRVLPTEGISHTLELVAALIVAGWDGALDVEIFSTPELFWGLPADEAARRAFAAVAAVCGVSLGSSP
jgi:sugar phosphate isomerase/epimerase